MKQLFGLLLITFSGTCNAQFHVSDASLKIDTMSLVTPCDCTSAAITYAKEVITLMEEVKRIQKKGSEMPLLNEEIRKRYAKHHQFFIRCMPIYNKEGSMGNCPNNTEVEELEKKLNLLQKKLHIE
nr:hypothetical protein [uncultured Fluviicola sp.]